MKIYDLVKKVLLQKPETRGSDKMLIWEVMVSLGLITVERFQPTHRPGTECIQLADFQSAPSFESITRARRKVQENHLELRANPEVEAMRKKKEEMGGNFVYHEEINS